VQNSVPMLGFIYSKFRTMYLAHPRSPVVKGHAVTMQNSCMGLTFAAMTTTTSVPQRVVRTRGATSKAPKEKRTTSFAADNVRLRQRHATNQPTASKSKWQTASQRRDNTCACISPRPLLCPHRRRLALSLSHVPSVSTSRYVPIRTSDHTYPRRPADPAVQYFHLTVTSRHPPYHPVSHLRVCH
jgi:hypothetical protein